VPKRREHQKQDRERRILRAAGRLFASRGYSRTNIRHIARASRLAVGTVYNYVASKPELLLLILRRETDELIASSEPSGEPLRGDPVETVAAWLDRFVDAIARHDRKLWRELFSAAIAEPLTIGARAFENDVRLVAQLAALLERLKPVGMLEASVPAARAAMAFYSVAFSWSMAFLMSDEMTVEQMRDEIRQGVRLVARGIFVRPPAARAEKPR
jgi:AcrR family transcriptional regulator